MKKSLLIVMLAAVAGGCMTTPGSQTPTHRWESTTAADEVQYRNDHARCQVQANVADDSSFSADSATFNTYKQCMVNRGYELTAYNGHE